jgi:lipid-binding SYLF domain-containing protein
MLKTNNRLVIFASLLLLVASMSTASLAQDRQKATVIAISTFPESAMDEADRARDAADIIRSHKDFSKVRIPRKLLEDANAIVVIPNYVTGAFGIGGSWGKGLLTRRDYNGKWLAPSYVKLSGVSFGFQAGVRGTDLVLIFRGKNAAKHLLRNRLKFGGEASVAVGPLGRDAELGAVPFREGIYSYSHAKGVFLGVALNGAVLTIDDRANRDAYGVHLFGDEIVLDAAVEVNDVVRPFVDAVSGINTATGNTDSGVAVK